jgi:hypothetical protein
MTNRKQRRRKQRRAHVDRTERVKPTPEAAQHHRPWPMQALLALGAKAGGLDADEFEAALEICETWRALTLGLGVAGLSLDVEHIGASSRAMSDRDAERCAIWFAWSLELPRGLPARLVSEIEDAQPIGSVDVLRHACRRWLKVKADRARPIDKQPAPMLTLRASSSVSAKLPPPPSARSAPAVPLSRAPALAAHRSITGRRS